MPALPVVVPVEVLGLLQHGDVVPPVGDVVAHVPRSVAAQGDPFGKQILMKKQEISSTFQVQGLSHKPNQARLRALIRIN